MKNMEYWLVAQMSLEAVLIGLVVFFLVRLRMWRQKLRESPKVESGLTEKIHHLAENQSLLEKRQQALEEMVQQLSLRVGQGPKPNNGVVGSQGQKSYAPSSPWESGLSLRAQVEALNRQGLSPEDIARRLRLNLAEVKVALDLCRVRPA